VKPTIGRIVVYTLSEHDADCINRRRVARPHEPAWPAGAQAHFGNSVVVGEAYPMVIVKVWNATMVNGQVLLDGNDVLWVTSVHEGAGPCSWAWPKRET